LELAYYTVADAAYFVGRLSRHATVIPRDGSLHPVVQKATGPLTRPAKLMVYVDADMLVTRPLEPLIERARNGRFVVFEDSFSRDRFFAEWSSPELGQAQRRPYVNSGLFALSWETGRELLPAFASMERELDITPTFVGKGGSRDDPYFYADQDLLNALLSTRFDGRVDRLGHELAPFPPFDSVELTDTGPALCAYADGTAPFVLHHTNRKPWLAPLPANAYSRLFSILVTDPDACMQLDAHELPLRLTRHPLAGFDRWRAASQHLASTHLRGRLGIGPRIERLRARLGES
jgi:hypothetical protein